MLTFPKRVRARRRTAALALAAALSTAAFLTPGAVTAAATTPGPNTEVTVPHGTGEAALRDASVFGTTPANTPETVSFILKERHLGELEDSVTSGPAGTLSVTQFARRYGQPGPVISALRAYLTAFGISAMAYADSVDVSATGTAGQFDRALSVWQQNYSVPAVPGPGGQPGIPAQRVHGTTQSPMLPCRLARDILSILGLTDYASFVDGVTRTPGPVSHSAGGVSLTHPGTTYTGDLTPEDFARTYGLNPLYGTGATGQGMTIGIVTLAGLDPSTPYYFWDNVLRIPVPAHRITVENIDGGPGAPSELAGSDESDLDVEQSGAVGAGARIIVYQGPNTDPGFADSFFAAASQDTADTVSSSWGESETYVAASVAAGQDADPFTGYLLYDPLASPALQAGAGGTSFVAPQLAGATAVIDQYVDGRTGFWNPSVYAFADSGRSPFTPLGTSGTANDNLYYTGTPGHRFNAGSGLGVPNPAKLAADFGTFSLLPITASDMRVRVRSRTGGP